MSRIGIMGGTFNPIHLAHLAMADAAWRQAGLDEIWFMPSKNPPHKTQAGLTDEKHRSRMIQTAITGRREFVFSDYELVRQGTTYTADTISYLKRDYPDHHFYFIMGGDSLFQIEKWHEPQKIMASCEILAFSRDGVSPAEIERHIHFLEKIYQAHIVLLQMPMMDISSSRIRELVSRGQTRELCRMLPREVEEYILQNHLYEGTFHGGRLC